MDKYIDKSREELLDIINLKPILYMTPAKSIDLLTDREIREWVFFLEEIEKKGFDQVEKEYSI
jgi:hypothetical protein